MKICSILFLGVVAAIASIVLNIQMGGAFFTVLGSYYLILLGACSFLFKRLLKISAGKAFLIAVGLVVCSVVSVRAFCDVGIYEPERFDRRTLLELDQELWQSTRGRIMLSYSPDLRDSVLYFPDKVAEDSMNLDQFNTYLHELIPDAEITIAKRYGYFDFGFRPRGYEFQIKVADL